MFSIVARRGRDRVPPVSPPLHYVGTGLKIVVMELAIVHTNYVLSHRGEFSSQFHDDGALRPSAKNDTVLLEYAAVNLSSTTSRGE